MSVSGIDMETHGGRTGAKGLSTGLNRWVTTVDHKRLGILFILAGLFFFAVGGTMAAAMRAQLAFPDNELLAPQTFNRLMTMHGTTMVFLVGMPIISGLANFLIPLMIGARDMAFPRLNALGFWLFLFGALLLYFSYIGGDGLYGSGSAPDVGWFAYAPLTEHAYSCLLYTSPSPRDGLLSRMPSSA